MIPIIFESLSVTLLGMVDSSMISHLGACNLNEANMYTKHILKINYTYTFINVIIFVALLQPLISIFDVSELTKITTYYIMLIYSGGSFLFYPLSFALPSSLRAAGDTKFVMFVSASTMFLFRVGAAYLFDYGFKMGILGTWVAMISDWIIRMTIFIIRYRNGKWQNNKVI